MRGGRLWNENLRKEEFATCGSKQQQQLRDEEKTFLSGVTSHKNKRRQGKR
jgi:hypothetical protein